MFIKKRILSLNEIHQVYLILKHALPEQEEKFLLDELEKITEKIKPGTIVKCLEIMYPNEIEGKSDIQLFTLFVRGLKENLFFDYANFIKGINGRYSRDRKN